MIDRADSRNTPVSGGANSSAAAQRPRQLGLLLVSAGLAFVLDATTKALAVENLTDGEPVRLFGGAIYLNLARSTGTVFSMDGAMTVILTVLIMLVVLTLGGVSVRVRSRGWALSLGLIIGGAVGNMADRLFRDPGPLRGGVIDFICVFDPWAAHVPMFNLADVCIVAGAVLAISLILAGREMDGSRVSRSTTSQQSGRPKL